MHPQLPGPVPPQQPVPPLGPPQRVPQQVRALVLVAGLALLALVSAWCGWEVGSRDLGRGAALPFVLPVVAVLIGVLLVWVRTVWKLRSDGRVLDGVGVLGREGIDLAALSGVSGAQGRGRVTLTLHTPQGRLTFDDGTLRTAGPQVFDAVGRAVWAGQEQGRYVVPAVVAGVWQMPVRPGAPTSGRGMGIAAVAVPLVVLVAGVAVGVVLGSV